jgi:UDP-N-acetylmuramate--alanine ligase
MKIPQDIGAIHFIGIGGIGMSGIAEVLLNLGYKVQGSDAGEGYTLQRLRDKGAVIFKGHSAENLGEAEVVVVSTAIKRDNVELMAARERRIPVVRRAEMLAELMRFKQSIVVAGTHGKTTTTSMVSTLLDAGGLDPTIVNGGIINAIGTNARLGAGDWMVVEADESDGSFLKLPADVAIITNIDPEHLDFYKDYAEIKQAFRTFAENLPFYGFAVMCIDHPAVQELVGQITDRRVITYGENPQADMRLVKLTNVKGVSHFSIVANGVILDGFELPMAGLHNALNAVAAITVAHELGVSLDDLKKGLKGFGGVKRRFTKAGEWNGVTIIDDYGHHPVEISAVLKAARASTDNRVIAIVQPHRYTRLKALFNDFCTCFNDADVVIVADTYAAGETLIEGATKHDLAEGLALRGHKRAMVLDAPSDIARIIKLEAKPGDYVIFLGAGTITNWAYALEKELASL